MQAFLLIVWILYTNKIKCVTKYINIRKFIFVGIVNSSK